MEWENLIVNEQNRQKKIDTRTSSFYVDVPIDLAGKSSVFTFTKILDIGYGN